MSMNNAEDATRLAQVSGNLVFMDVPRGTEFGMDLSVYYVEDKFKGVKLIPPGFHFVYYAAVSKQSQAAPRQGFFHMYSQKELVALRWDAENEGVSTQPISHDDTERLRSNLLGDLDRYLGAYQYESWRKWVGLTSHVTENLLNRIQPLSKIISSAVMMPAANVENQKGKDGLPDLKPVPGTEIRFTVIPPRILSPSISGCMDSTYRLEQMLAGLHGGAMEILGELQIAFVSFIIGQVGEAFDHWKSLVDVLCHCFQGLAKYPELFSSFISVLYFQIQEIPDDFYPELASTGDDNFLEASLRDFFSNLEEHEDQSVTKTLRQKAQNFKDNLTRTKGWDLESEDQPLVEEHPDSWLW